MSNRWALILLLGGGLTLFMGVKRMPSEIPAYFASKRFAAANAVITDWTEETSGSGRRAETTQYLRFKYVVNGQEFTGDNRVTRADDTRGSLQSLVQADGNDTDLTVYYDPQNPSLVSVKHVIPLTGLLSFTAIGGGLMALGGLVLLNRWRERAGGGVTGG